MVGLMMMYHIHPSLYTQLYSVFHQTKAHSPLLVNGEQAYVSWKLVEYPDVEYTVLSVIIITLV